MDRISFEYSTKNIPTASKSSYLKKFIEKTELFMKRMRWKAYFFLNPKTTPTAQETYGFSTQRSPPVVNELKKFEECMANLIQRIEFENKPNDFQNKLLQDLKATKSDSKLTIKADKTTNYYKMDREKYNELVNKNVTKTYKKANKSEVLSVNREAKRIAENIKLSDRIDQLAEKEVFITLKDHKPNFENNPTCRLISPTKSEIGHVSKVILSKLVASVVESTGLNLWKSTREVLEWYRKFPNKQEGSFINFDIVDFYPSITEQLLLRAIDFANQYTEIQECDKDIIIHAKRTLIFNAKEPWKKKGNESGFDITMGSFDGAESCELVVCYMLSLLQAKYGKSVGLYRDDGLGISTGTPREIEGMKKDICKTFHDNELRVTIEVNKKMVNFLDVTLDLNSGQHMPYMKPNNTLQYVNTKSNHPPVVLKNIPVGINKRLSEISSNEEIFNKAVPVYQKALDGNGYNYNLYYEKPKPETKDKSRKRNIIWYNPPYDRNVKTNIGKEFLKILDKCFPVTKKLHKIFNRNTVKISYSCMPNVKAIIEGNNRKLLSNNPGNNEDHITEKKCSCPKNAKCPLDGECLTKDIVYRAVVTCGGTVETYVGLTATSFKSRYANHKASFKTESKRNATELSKHIWDLKDNNLDYAIKWNILCRASHYSNSTKRCNLCIAEKFFILCKPRNATLNKRNELVSKCRHKGKFLLGNVK